MRFAAPGNGIDGGLAEALFASRSGHHCHAAATPTSFEEAAAVPTKSSTATCSPDGEMIWQKSPDGKSNKYFLCYAPAYRHAGQGPTGGQLQCDPNSFVTVEGPKFCCRNPRININGTKMHAKEEICGDLQAEFDMASQKIRYLRGPSNDGTPELMYALEASSLGTTLPSPIGVEAMSDGSEWKLLLGQRCKGREGTLITWPSGRAEMCPTGTQPVHGSGYMSWQCDGSYKKESRLYCCSVNKPTEQGGTKQMQCVPNLVDQAPPACKCAGVNANGWGEDEAKGFAKGENDEVQGSSGLPPLPVLLLTSFGLPAQSRRPRRRGCVRQLGQDFL